MPLPTKLTPREESEITPAALSARAGQVVRSLRGDLAAEIAMAQSAAQDRLARAAKSAVQSLHKLAGGPVGESDLASGGMLVPDQAHEDKFTRLLKDWDVSKAHHNQYTDVNPAKEPKGRAAGAKPAGDKPDAGPAGAKPNGSPDPRATPLTQPNKAEVAAWRAAGGAAKLAAGVKGALASAVEKIKGAPQALKGAVMHEVGLVKTAAQGLKSAVTGKEVTPEQKAAMRTVALKVAVKLAFAAVGAALPGVGHAVGSAIEHAVPHFAEALAHHLAAHAAEHTVEHLAKHAAQRAIGVTFKADLGDDDGTELFTNTILAGIQDALASMTDKDWDDLTSGVAPTDSAEGAGLGDFAGQGEDQTGPDGKAPPGEDPADTTAGPPKSGVAARTPKAPGKPRPPAPGKGAKLPSDEDDGIEPAAKNSPQVPGPDERVGGAEPGAGYTVRRDTPVGYAVSQKVVGEEGHTEGYDAPGQPLPTGRAPRGPVIKKVDYQGVPVHVDRPAGFVQKSELGDLVYKFDYGFIPGIAGDVGTGLDVFLGPKANDTRAQWAVHQKADSQFSEYAILFGFEDADKAAAAFEEHEPSATLKCIQTTSVQMVKALLGLEPAEVTKALLADAFEDSVAAALDLAEVRKAEWSSAEVNDLPDSAFLHVESGGEKVDGKTTPKTLRHFPVRGPDGKPDAAHVRNALARIPQSNLPADVKASCSAAARKLLDDINEAAVAKASVHVDEHHRSTGARVSEHDRRAPLSGEDRAPRAASGGKTPRASGSGSTANGAAPRAGHGLDLLHEAAQITDARSLLHSTLNVVSNALDIVSQHASDRAGTTSRQIAADGKKPGGDKLNGDKAAKPDPAAAAKVAGDHEQAAAEHARAAVAAAEAGDKAGVERHQEAAEGHKTAAEKTHDALDRLHSDIDDPKAWADLQGELDAGQAHAEKVAVAKPDGTGSKADDKGAGSGGDQPREDDGKFAQKAAGPDVRAALRAAEGNTPTPDRSLEGLAQKASDSADSMTRPFIPVVPAAEGTGDPGFINERHVRKADEREVEIVEVGKADDAAPVEQRYILGIVLKPSPSVDAQFDTYDADEIAKSAHRWMEDYRNIDLQHKVLVNGHLRPVESYIAPCDLIINGRKVAKGTWLLACRVVDDEIWAQIKAGQYTGWSISGLARRTPV
jgi:hypothetical protein